MDNWGIKVVSSPDLPDFNFKKAFPYAFEYKIEKLAEMSEESYSSFTDRDKAFAIEAMNEYEGSKTVSQSILSFIGNLPIVLSEDILENKKRKALEVFDNE